jgi:hypothetical protein
LAVSPISDVALAKATFDEWWTFGSTLLGAVVGATVAGVTSYILARQSNKETAAREWAKRRNDDKALAFSLIVKIGEVVSSLASLHHQTEGNIAAAEAEGVDGPLWCKMLPMVGMEKRIHFESQEIAILLPLKMDSTINSLFILDDQHNSLLATMQHYSAKRTAFGERFGADMSGSVGSTTVTIEQYRLAGPPVAELEALAIAIRTDSKKWFEGAIKVFIDVASQLEANFSDVGFPKFKVADYNSVRNET